MRACAGFRSSECTRKYPDHVWTGPDPDRCGLQRLGDGGSIINDTCTPARCTQRLLIAEVAQQVEADCDEQAWALLCEAQQEAKVRVHSVHCWQHIRNIFLAAMSKVHVAVVVIVVAVVVAAAAAADRR